MKMNSLIAPEVWKALLPVHKPSSTNKVSKNLKILSTVCGIHDVTSMLQDLVTNGELMIAINKVKGLVEDKIYEREMPLLGWNLTFVYQYDDELMHVCSINHDEKPSRTIHVSKVSDHPIVNPRKDINGGFSLASVVYGGMI